MIAFLVTVHVLVCIALVIIVLLNAGKGAEVGAVFGGSQAMFGGEGPANFMNKLTAAVAIGFMATSLTLALLSSRPGKGSVVEQPKPAPVTAPAKPAASPEDLEKAMREMATGAAKGEAKPGSEAKPAPAAKGTQAAPEAKPAKPAAAPKAAPAPEGEGKPAAKGAPAAQPK